MHFKVSMIKSAIRLMSCATCLVLLMFNLMFFGIIALCSGFILAEILGVVEEYGDEE